MTAPEAKSNAEIAREIERFEQFVDKGGARGCWLWTGSKKPDGYGQFMYRGRSHGAHRVAWSLYRGEIKVGRLICHNCDVPACVNPDHLYEGTFRSNNIDCRNRKRIANQKLSLEDAALAKTLIARGFSLDKIGALFGVHKSTIGLISTGETFADVPALDAKDDERKKGPPREKVLEVLQLVKEFCDPPAASARVTVSELPEPVGLQPQASARADEGEQVSKHPVAEIKDFLQWYQIYCALAALEKEEGGT